MSEHNEMIAADPHGFKTEYVITDEQGKEIVSVNEDELIRRDETLDRIFAWTPKGEYAASVEEYGEAIAKADIERRGKKPTSEEAKKIALFALQELRKKTEETMRRMEQEAHTVLEASFPVINSRPASFWDFPYSEFCILFDFTYEWFLGTGDWVRKTPHLHDLAMEGTNGAYDLYLEALNRIEHDFTLTVEAIGKGFIAGDWIKRNGTGAIVVEHSFCNLLDRCEWFEAFSDNEPISALEAFDEGMLEFRERDDQYRALCALCSCGYEKTLRDLLRPKKTRQSKARTDIIKDSVDLISNVLFYRPKNQSIEPYDYMSGEPKRLETGKGLAVSVTMQNDFALDQPLEEWLLDSTDGFWHSMALSLADKGYVSFRGSDLLDLGGYTKPTAKDMRDTMAECHRSLMKMRRHDILIDTSEEYKDYKSKRGADLRQATTLRSLLNADITYLNFEDGVNDFRVTLNPREEGRPITAFALGEYAQEKGQFISFSRGDFVFKGMRLTKDHRRVWLFIIRQIKCRKTSNVIYFDTVLLNTNLDGVSRDAKKRILNQLRKMLDARVSDKEKLEALRAKERLTVKEKKELERLESMALISGYKWDSKKGCVTLKP